MINDEATGRSWRGGGGVGLGVVWGGIRQGDNNGITVAVPTQLRQPIGSAGEWNNTGYVL